jgi:hypothetical protein
MEQVRRPARIKHLVTSFRVKSNGTDRLRRLIAGSNLQRYTSLLDKIIRYDEHK